MRKHRRFSVVIAIAGISLIAAASASAAGPKTTNIVLIMADDLGQYALGCYGGVESETPNIDRLASQGMRFTQCHSRAMCTPTRHVLLTGKQLHRMGPNWTLAEPTMPRVLKQAGYHTGFAGKWMVGEMPWNAGFDEGVIQVNWYRHWGPHVMVWNSGGYLKELDLAEPLPDNMRDHGVPIEGPQPRATHLDGEYGPRVLNRFALDYIERHKDEPFFLYYPMKLPHSPLMPTPDSEMTADAKKAIDVSNDFPVVQGTHDIPGDDKWARDTVVEIDRLVGNVVAKLEACGIVDDTILIFTSDNGPGTDGQVASSVTRIPGRKGGTLEGGTRAPFIVRWPNVVEPGSQYGGLVDFTDVLPTLADAVGVLESVDTTFDGRSFLRQLRGETGAPRECIYFHGGWNPAPLRNELLQGRSWRTAPYAPEGHEMTSRINYELNPNFRYVRGKRYKLYSDGRFYDLDEDLHEWNPIKPGSGSPEAEAARQKLQSVLDSKPSKHDDPVGCYKYE